MNHALENLLIEWPLNVIRDVDIATLFDSDPKRYGSVNRALKKGVLVGLRRGVYLIGKPYRKKPPSHFQISHTIYRPSYISFESALVYHQWIPEAVYTTKCATSKRSSEFETPLGIFQYLHVPDYLFYMGVQRFESDEGASFIADPWRAIADHYYVYNRDWKNLHDLASDLRIEIEDMQASDLTSLKTLSDHYQSRKVREFLTSTLKELNDGN